MARSALTQALQLAASSSYDDAVASANVQGTAEGQSSIEGDLNIVRTLMKGIVGETNWFDAPNMTIKGIADKQFIELRHIAAFDGVTASGTTTNAWDTAIKTLTGHANGAGNSTTVGVILDATSPHKLSIRDASTNDPITDGSNNEVYARLSWVATEYILSFYSDVNGVETAFNMPSTSLDLAYVAFSQVFENLNWERFLDFGFHDVSGMVGTILDDDVTVDGMADLLVGFTTQAQVNAKLDDLGSILNGEGASLVAVEDSAAYYAGGNVEAVLAAIAVQLGGDSDTAFNFTEANVLADNDAVYAALEKLDLKWGDLASVLTGEGASLVGLEDSSGYYTATNVEAALQEVWAAMLDVGGWTKVSETTVSPITSGVAHSVPGGNSYTIAAGGLNMDVYYNGQLLLEGAGNDYTEDTTTTIKFLFTVPTGANLTYAIRK